MSTADTPSLYARIGGYDAIHAFAAAAIRKGMAHPDIGHIWGHMSESAFFKEHANFVDFLSAHWGGTARYRGRDMATVHRGMGLTDVHWAAMFDCLEETYEEFGVPQDIRDEVNAFFERFKPVVVGSPSFRDVVLANPGMDPTKGMKSVGVIWPAPGSGAAAAPEPPKAD